MPTSNGYVLPAEGFVRLGDVLKVVPVGRSSWWAGVAAGRYPSPVKLGPRTTAWRVDDIRRLIGELSEGRQDER